ncbi:MAG: hypothetical protein IKL74_05915 [Clostridia bacterium]|nr:hypothetical protein [Clostridia bacterium]
MKNYKGAEKLTPERNKALAGNMSKEERDDAFSKLIKNDYKEQFQDRFNREFGRRYKGMKETEEELIALKEALRPLMEHYNEKDTVSLVKRILDESKNKEKSSKGDAALIKKQYDKWLSEAKETKKKYPSFDFKKEFNNSEFRAGLKSGIPMTSLYRAMHFDELSKSISDKASKATLENIRSGNGRIKEAGNERSASVKTKKSVESLTGDEIEEILERVRRGEKITFGA